MQNTDDFSLPEERWLSGGTALTGCLSYESLERFLLNKTSSLAEHLTHRQWLEYVNTELLYSPEIER